MEPIYTNKDLEIENQKLDDEIKWLNNEIESFRNNQEEYEKHALQLKKLYDGVIDEDGNLRSHDLLWNTSRVPYLKFNFGLKRINYFLAKN